MQDRDTAQRISDIPRLWAARAPDNVAVHEGERTIRFAQLWEGIGLARRYLEGQGVGPGDRVMVVGENCLAVITLIFALPELQAWPVVTNARLTAREVEEIRAHCTPRLMLFTHGASPDALRHGLRYRAREIAPAGLGPLMAADVDRGSDPEPLELARDVAALIYTSGTTGQPKGVMVTHRGLLHYARVTAESRSMSPTDCAYAVMPMSHIFGLATLLLATFQAGGSLHLAARFNVNDACAALQRDAISILQGVPAMFSRILAHLRRQGVETLHSRRLRYLYTGGGPLELTLKRNVEAMFGQPLHHGYGMTEYAGSLFITRMDRPRDDCSAGEIVEGAQLRVVGPDGEAVPQGSPGELWVRGPGVMRGYYRAPAQTAEALRPDGWLNTGDIGRLGPDGALYIVGRTRDVIIRSGFSVYPIEVESVINSHPAVRVSAVVGSPAADGNEAIIAFVEMREGEPFDAAALHAYLAEQLSPYKRPARIVRLAAIPTTASGKLHKHQLRRMAAELA
ncbi:acyl-CoA synthetase (AMP-forming)/AMP-acid ligase II [Cupriavidus gilardii J11]|uniref:Acyl-CoA synthetase (AMP-forming)/AMP-acid ligase II n=1 Tax=Cupriavidus gilardii J11 TaxID=936133 RepID=A0A562BTL6_9BURK|nr:class I adenylate-forming enzyme family protein [Cupriavidus gilardii]TWG88617.1 acyl-CoA synthetase (AMP-forming)/AMP-acid ligase II [Cupriavidus gilardii J11]